MLNKEIKIILEKSKQWGWVLEPDAKRILSLCGFQTPKYAVAKKPAEAVAAARKIGYPVVVKIVSPEIVHKSDVKGVIVGIKDDERLVTALEKFRKLPGFAGMLIDEMTAGVELIIGAKNDVQFGPMILLGFGGVGVEIYKDVSLRMAPLNKDHVESMMKELKAYPLLTGYRGSKPVNIAAVQNTLIRFSKLMMDIRVYFESVDLNPVMCDEKSCTIVDARIILKD
ncbi:MAG: acetyl-CoA synthetase [Deltaproteobacteria bacterium HGW-Deltaproteobacteria-12]|jgi:acyl-CoA synthetase (NDP forming)|nr:MAG: acetyl-CoA synthetase [Deltaproteobacteria bacterium HGW-Deltaproteobacteria-12]